jgi:hypothetical protein
MGATIGWAAEVAPPPAAQSWVEAGRDDDGTTLLAYWDGDRWTAVMRRRPNGTVQDRVLLNGGCPGDRLAVAGLRLLDARREERRGAARVSVGGLLASVAAAAVIAGGIANGVWPGLLVGVLMPLVVTAGVAVALVWLGKGRGSCTLAEQAPKPSGPVFEGYRLRGEMSTGARIAVVVGVVLAALVGLFVLFVLAVMLFAFLVETANEGL